MGVDIAGLDGKFTSADDIARPRGKVFDDDHAPAYTGGGVGLTQLQCGSSALVACLDTELRGRLSKLRSPPDRLPKPSTFRTLTPCYAGPRISLCTALLAGSVARRPTSRSSAVGS